MDTHIWTSRYSNKGLANWDATKVAITVSLPRWPVGYPFKRLTLLAPTGELFTMTDEDEFRLAYFERLDSIGVDTIRAALRQLTDGGTKDAALLCFERTDETWCHRRTFAAWWQERTGEAVEELPDLPVSDQPGTTARQSAFAWDKVSEERK